MRCVLARLSVLLLVLGAFALAAPVRAQQPAALPAPVWELAGEQASAGLCAVFDRPLAREEQATLKGLVTIEPAADVALSIREERLCVSGLAHGEAVRVTVRPGVTARDGARLASAASHEARIPDRAPQAAFASRGHVLPRLNAEGLPVTTVNVERVEVEIFRVVDRQLVQELRRGQVEELLDGWDVSQLVEESGQKIWSGTLATPGERNRDSVTALPLASAIGTLEPGVYAATVWPEGQPREEWDDLATQWFVVSDVALTTFMGERAGLVAQARSIATGQPVSGATLSLLSRNNRVLGTATSDAAGVARFDAGLVRGSGGDAPAVVLASAPAGDFVYLDLDTPAFDLTDRGVGGRTAPGPLDAFLYPERGIYRPGETARITVLLRDDQARAVTGMPVTLDIIRPDGSVVASPVLTGDAAGGLAHELAFERTSQTGTWTLAARVGSEGRRIGATQILLEDFVPPRIEVALEPSAPSVAPGEALDVSVRADFLYGAPAAGLKAEVAAVIRRAATPFPALEGFSFGLAEEDPSAAGAVQLEAVEAVTDAEGVARLSFPLDGLPDTSHPLELALRASVFDVGGRPVQERAAVPIARQPLLVGVKPGFDGTAPRNSSVPFQVVAVTPAGALTDRPLSWVLYREDWDWYWERGEYGGWTWRRVRLRDEVLAEGSVQASAAAPATVDVPIADWWGQHRFEVFDPETGAAASTQFYAGWSRGGDSGETPDKVAVTPEGGPVAPGGVARVHIKPPFDAEVTVAVADTRIHGITNHRIPAAGAVVEVPMPAEAVAGTYVLVNAFAPADNQRSWLPTRAIGVAWVAAETAPRRLEVTLDVPERTRPEQELVVPVSVAGAVAGQPVFLTLAAVDDGILQITDFAAPDIGEHYLGKRSLGVLQRDLYGSLIDPMGARAGAVRSGGDGSGARQLGNLPDPNVEVLSLYSGIVALRPDGRAEVPLRLPEFNGRVRLMAVAWSADRIGNAETTMVVRAPVIVELAVPRFLAPDDQADLALSLDNVEGPAGLYRIAMTADGVLSFADGTRESVAELTLEAGARLTAPVRVTAPGIGSGTVTLTVTGPDGLSLSRTRSIGTRPGNPHVTRRSLGRLMAGEQSTLSAGPLVAGLRPETATVTVGFNNAPEFDLAALLKGLSRYPYGCAEQTTSTAMPLLFVSDLAEAAGIQDQGVSRTVLQKAVDRLVSMQSAGGGFGSWSPADPARLWLSAYVMDFLGRARAKGLTVSERAFTRGLDWLQEEARFADEPDEGIGGAYAWYVLARNGRAEPGGLRQFQRVLGDQLPTPLARAQLAAALAGIGARDAAPALLTYASATTRPGDHPYYGDYGSALRDQAALLALMAEGNEPWSEAAARLGETVAEAARQRDWLSTQEMAWLARAAAATMAKAGGMALEIGGQPGRLDRAVYRDLPPEGSLTATNHGTTPINRIVTVSGVPIEPQPPEQNGFVIRRLMFDRFGVPLDPRRPVRQSELVVIVLEGGFDGTEGAESLVVDLLPGGFEIENLRLNGSSELGDFAWLGELTRPTHVEYRDDRFVAALDLGSSWHGEERGRQFRLAYLARAVTPGRFALPGPFVEAMYRPHLFARGPSGSLAVAGAP